MRKAKSIQTFARALATTSATWWLLLSLYAAHVPISTSANENALSKALDGIEASIQLLLLNAIVCCLCFLIAFKRQTRRRTQHLLTLKEDAHFGLHSSMGAIGALLKSPLSTPKLNGGLPDWFIQSVEYEHAPLILKFIESTRLSNPRIAHAMASCLTLLCLNKDCPASSVSNDTPSWPLAVGESTQSGIKTNHHGNCSLLDHSVRVAAYALIERESFSYQGLQTDLSVLIAAQNGFELDRQDALLILLALVHDIGKIKTFQLNEQKDVVAVKGHHGPVGAALLAQMDCIKALSVREQHVLYKAIYHYHSPYHYTVSSMHNLGDERAVASMMLLIKADKRAGQAERLGFTQKSDVLEFKKELEKLSAFSA